MSKEKLENYFTVLGKLSRSKFTPLQEIKNAVGDKIPYRSIVSYLDKWTEEGLLKKRIKKEFPPNALYKLTKKGVSFFNGLKEQIQKAIEK